MTTREVRTATLGLGPDNEYVDRIAMREIILQAMANQGITRSTVARRAGVSSRTIRRILNGDTYGEIHGRSKNLWVTFRVADLICTRLGVDCPPVTATRSGYPGRVRHVGWDYGCECTNAQCKRVVRLSRTMYKRLSAKGAVRHVSCVTRRAPNILDAYGDAIVVASRSSGLGSIASVGPRERSPRERVIGVRAW